MPFEVLTTANRLIDSSAQRKNLTKTVQDLHRTCRVILSAEQSTGSTNNPTNSWWSDYKAIDFVKGLFGSTRADKTQIFLFPTEDQIVHSIFPHFSQKEAIQKYIMETANQNNFLNAIQTEIITRLNAAGFLETKNIDKGANANVETTIEFRRNEDGSFTVFEVIELPQELRSMSDDGDIIVGKSRMAKIILTSRISVSETVIQRNNAREIQSEISHDIEEFQLIPQDLGLCKKVFDSGVFDDLMQYVPERMQGKLEREIVSHEQETSGQCQNDSPDADSESLGVDDLEKEIVTGGGRPILVQQQASLPAIQVEEVDGAAEAEAEALKKSSSSKHRL